MKNSPFTLSVRLCLSCGPEHPTPTRHESGSLVNRDRGEGGRQGLLNRASPPHVPQGLGGRRGASVPASGRASCISLSPRTLLGTLPLSHRQKQCGAV